MNDEIEILEEIKIPTKIKYKDIIWVPESESTKIKQHVDISGKQNYFDKWLRENKQVGDVFLLDEFYKEHPRHKKEVGCKKRLDNIISKLISDGCIDMWSHKDEFKVLKIC